MLAMATWWIGLELLRIWCCLGVPGIRGPGTPVVGLMLVWAGNSRVLLSSPTI